MKFRNCYFEYDGVYSGKYDLRLVYVQNQPYNFDSGGSFDFKFGQIPYFHEQLYYGKDYSENPLQFEIEILKVDGYISDEQMLEIKEWLFGCNGWKKFVVKDGRNNKSLRCILTPITDITEGEHYKGLRCTLRNASPFWYGESKEVTIKNADLIKDYNPPSKWFGWNNFQVDIPKNDCVDCDIYPEIIVKTDRTIDNMYGYGSVFCMANTDVSTLTEGCAKTSDGQNYLNEEKSRISFDNTYLESTLETYNYHYSYDETNSKHLIYMQYSGGQLSLEIDTISEPTEDQIKETIRKAGYHPLTYDGETKTGTAVYAKDNVTVNTRYVLIQSEQCPHCNIKPIVNTDLPKPIFRLHYGTNICRIYYGWAYESITFRYTPLYRMGAF